MAQENDPTYLNLYEDYRYEFLSKKSGESRGEGQYEGSTANRFFYQWLSDLDNR